MNGHNFKPNCRSARPARARQRAALWAFLITLPAWVLFEITQGTAVTRPHVVFNIASYIASYVGGLVLLPGAILTGIAMAAATLIGNGHIIRIVAAAQFLIITPVLNWLFYFAVVSAILNIRAHPRQTATWWSKRRFACISIALALAEILVVGGTLVFVEVAKLPPPPGMINLASGAWLFGGLGSLAFAVIALAADPDRRSASLAMLVSMAAAVICAFPFVSA